MALLNINGNLVEFSKDKNILVLTDEEYETYPDAKKYLACITETRMIVNEVTYERTEGEIVGVDFFETDVFIKSKLKLALLTNGQIMQYDAFMPIRDMTVEYPFSHDGVGNIFYDRSKKIYCSTRIADYDYQHEALNSLVDHVYHSDGRFFASTYWTNAGNLVATPHKIIRCTKYQGHLLAVIEGDDKHYLILLCYAIPYFIECDILFPSSMVKSAANVY